MRASDRGDGDGGDAERVGAGDAGTAVRGAAGGLAVVRAQVDAAVQVPAGGGVGVAARLRRRDPRRLAHPQGTHACTCAREALVRYCIYL